MGSETSETLALYKSLTYLLGHTVHEDTVLVTSDLYGGYGSQRDCV